MAAATSPGKRRYCEKWGIDFYEVKETLDNTRPPSWSKILAVQSVLPKYDWVVWCDVDTLIWRADIDIRTFP